MLSATAKRHHLYILISIQSNSWIHMHLNFGLFADILRELAATVGRIPKDDVLHRDQLAKAVAELHTALTKV